MHTPYNYVRCDKDPPWFVDLYTEQALYTSSTQKRAIGGLTKYIYISFSRHSIQLHILKICSCKLYIFFINNNSHKDQYGRRTLQVWKLPSLAVECNGYLVIWIGFLPIACSCLLETHAVASTQVVRLHGCVILRQVSRLLTRTHARTHTHTHAR